MKCLSPLCSIIFAVLIACTSCEKNIEPSIPDTKGYPYTTVTIIKDDGNATDWAVVGVQALYVREDTVHVALDIYAAMFYLDLSLKNSDKALQMLSWARSNQMPLKLRLFENTVHEIAEMSIPSPEEIKKYKNMWAH